MIITSATFQNFASFKSGAKMNFLVNDNAPPSNHFDSRNGERFSKVSSIFGANASGKTNLILGFRFLRWFISHSFSYPHDKFSEFNPFATEGGNSSHFEVTFYIKNVFYKFSLEINSERVLSEILESRRNKRLLPLYSRKYVPSSNSYEFQATNIGLEKDFIGKVRPNASVISTARQYNHPELSQLRDSWNYIFIKSKRPYEKDMFYFDLSKISKFYSENERHFSQAKDFLKKADLGLMDINIKVAQNASPGKNNSTLFIPWGTHQNQGQKFELPFLLESSGTFHLYEMLSFIFPTLENGSVFLIDEIENNLHPNMLSAIVNLFTSQDSNPNGAQLICTTHTPTLMSDLSKYQIFIVEKNKECESEVYRLDEVQGVRSDDNLFKKYLAGAYGGIPDIDL